MAAKSFEKNYEELLNLIKEMENNELSLKELLKDFEKATLLYENCTAELEKAKNKITIIKEKNNSYVEELFEEREK